jgi:glutaredoxin 3
MIKEQSRIEIYTTRFCGYCRAAKAFLEARGLSYAEIDVSSDDEKRSEMVKRSQQRTVPQIFIDGKSVGGFSELTQLLK